MQDSKEEDWSSSDSDVLSADDLILAPILPESDREDNIYMDSCP